jgi:glycosyltransferase involved in cell wall biosynthesis
MRIGLYYESLSGWQGGRDVFAMLFRSLQVGCEGGDQITIIAHQARDSVPWRLAHVGKRVLTTFPWDREWLARELLRTSKRQHFHQLFGAAAEIDWVTETDSLTKRERMLAGFDAVGLFQNPPEAGSCEAWVAWVTDCQHRRLPQNFSTEERARRDLVYFELMKTAPVIVVNCQDAKSDLMRYFGPGRAEIVALPFAAVAERSWFEIDLGSVVKKYRLPEKYFICSNQFWKHKNHALVLEALAFAKTQGMTFRVVFTGDTHDFGASDHFDKLMGYAEELDVVDNCCFLGLLPKLDQIGVMRSAVAVIQPTRFEGTPGGLAIYDAVSLGQQVIVSDIPVNREIEQYVNEYFDSNDSQALFFAMSRAAERYVSPRAKELLLAEGLERRRQCGKVIRAAFARAIEISRSLGAVERIDDRY